MCNGFQYVVLEHDGFAVHPPLFRTFVAEVANEKDGARPPSIIGYALYYNTYSTWRGKAMFLEDLYVTEEYRRKKIGSALFRAVAKVPEQPKCNYNKPTDINLTF